MKTIKNSIPKIAVQTGLVALLLGFGGALAQPSSALGSGDADTAIKVATSCGTVVGQLGFGIVSDIFGRKRIVGYDRVPT